MNRINLLPVAERRPDIPYGRIAVFFVVVVLLVIGCIYGVEEYSLRLLEGEVAATQARYEELLPVRQAMEAAGDKQKQIDAKQALVNELEKSRTTPYNLLPRIAGLLTNDIWLDETIVNKTDGRIITLKGETGEYDELAAFVTRLEAEPLFYSVMLKSTEGDTKLGTLKFTIDLKLKEL
ncbi:MAG: Fimbrial assembly family protein [Firmicutes bacterium]|nr:Fimbrial assembly family protein [Bacillota bacterium]